jgi:acetamidase/formamidase
MKKRMKALAHCLTLLGLVATSAGLQAETHRLVPAAFYNTFSGAHAPALRIKSGDRVITRAVDGAGTGADGKMLAPGSNPQTGPFYIEGAEPGDLLVVSIEKLEPNRSTGMSTSVMAASSVDSGSLSNKARAAEVPWTIDKAKGVVRFDLSEVIRGVDWRARYSTPIYELPLRPMLGSVGVAPAGTEAPATTASGPFGGNLDYAGLTAGVRIMLPVFQPGALLFLRHPQARQGDGRVGGGGIAMSMDVEFSVDLVKKKEWPHSSVMRPSTVAGEFEIAWPRMETKDYVMAVGSAPSLLQALQHATTELHHWLDDDFGLSERTVSILLGQAIEYEIGRVSEQSATVVAKVRKSYLPQPAGARQTLAP